MWGIRKAVYTFTKDHFPTSKRMNELTFIASLNTCDSVAGQIKQMNHTDKTVSGGE